MPFFRLSELAATTGVAPRTIRYYIAEGLLPPPQGSGPAAVYTAGHRDRLELIGHWKGQYVSLREIKRRLVGLTDAKVRAALLADEAPSAMPVAAPSPDAAPIVPLADTTPARRMPPPPGPMAATLAPAGNCQQWERIILADGIELHVRDDRRQERLLLDALIRSARALLGES